MLVAAMERVPKREGYAWREMVFTMDRDPCDPMLHTAEALRARAFALLDAGKRVNDAIIARHEGSGFRTKLEMSGTGHVHGHGLAYSPFLPIAQIEAIVRKVPPPPGCRWGKTTIALAKTDDDGIAREIAKYVTKGPSPMSEGWQAGEGRWVMDPVLAARWEIATMGMKLSREYGSLREALQAKPEPVEPVEPVEPEGPSEEPKKTDLPDRCEHCGETGSFKWVILPAEETIKDMHARGLKALRGSRWKPPKRE